MSINVVSLTDHDFGDSGPGW